MIGLSTKAKTVWPQAGAAQQVRRRPRTGWRDIMDEDRSRLDQERHRLDQERHRLDQERRGTDQERRGILRHRALKAGHIMFNSAVRIDCRVRNESPAGACLEVASQVGIPEDFVLVIDRDHLKHPCHVIWRTMTRLGVEFKAA
jgi:hypothetical protein